MDSSEIKRRLNQDNLRYCGGFYPEPSDQLEPSVSTAIIVGNTGSNKTSKFWQTFEAQRSSGQNPLEDWTRDQLTQIAEDLNADVIFPFDGPPYIPIQTWAERAEPVHTSPFGLLIHPEFGLWHAYRGVLLFKDKIALPEIPRITETASPCLSCRKQPCTTSCPVDAIKTNDFNLTACTDHLATAEGSECLKYGCIARRACPVGQEYAYSPAQSEFHLTAFLKTFGRK